MSGETATLFIWYPKGFDVGHCSLYIGDFETMSQHDPYLALTQEQLDSFAEYSPDEIMNMKWPSNHRYVSWWPQSNSKGGKFGRMFKKCKHDYAECPILDSIAEGELPHVRYHIRGLDEMKMLMHWEEIRTKDGARYSMFRKNCSGVVASVLIAGGLGAFITGSVRDYHQGLVTPKMVARWGNALRDKGLATKERASHCPPKSRSLFSVAFGLR